MICLTGLQALHCECVCVRVYKCVCMFRSMCRFVSIYVCSYVCLCVCRCICVWEREREIRGGRAQVCAHLYVACTGTCVYVHVEARGWHWVSLSLSILCFETGSLRTGAPGVPSVSLCQSQGHRCSLQYEPFTSKSSPCAWAAGTLARPQPPAAASWAFIDCIARPGTSASRFPARYAEFKVTASLCVCWINENLRTGTRIGLSKFGCGAGHRE